MAASVRIIALGVLTVAACRRTPPAEQPPRPHAPPAASRAGATPRSRAEFPTTSGDLALSNLASQIDGVEKVCSREPAAKARLVPLLLLRGELLGRVADYERADKLAAELVAAMPRSAESYQLRATVAAKLHRFQQAEKDLARAEKLGANPRELQPARTGLLESTGRAREALAQRESEAAVRPDLATLTTLGALQAELGDGAAAGRLFVRAQDGYRGVSPFPLAYLYLQEGLAAERAGRLSRAVELFSAALERVPGYAPAASHLASGLASMGQRKRAMAVLEPVLRSSDDPELVGQMAVLLRAEHRTDEADRQFAQADERYRALVARLPEAFSDHAARFYLAWGGHADRALALAQANLAVRPTREAHALAIDAAIAAGDSRYACQVADRLKEAGPLTPLAQIDAARAFQACGRTEEAHALLSQAERALGGGATRTP
jgi:tetratricopeptide (TPR) repeat protein